MLELSGDPPYLDQAEKSSHVQKVTQTGRLRPFLYILDLDKDSCKDKHCSLFVDSVGDDEEKTVL